MEARAKLFQYAVIYNPTKDEEKDGKKAEVVIDVKTVLAKDQSVVGMIAIREIPNDYAEKLEQLDVVIRPF